MEIVQVSCLRLESTGLERKPLTFQPITTSPHAASKETESPPELREFKGQN